MDRRRFLLTSLAGALAQPLAAEAQQAEKVFLIGTLREVADLPPLFVEALRELGWIEGRTFKLEKRNAGRREQLPALAAELVRLEVDLIFTGGTPATRAAKDATKTIPIVFSLADDPVATGLVASFVRPGGNLTGFAHGVYEPDPTPSLRRRSTWRSTCCTATAAT